MTKVFLNSAPDRQLISRIIDILVLKSKVDNLPQNEQNKIKLGGVDFWFANQKSTPQTFLVYTLPPHMWDIDNIKIDLEKLEISFFDYVIQ